MLNHEEVERLTEISRVGEFLETIERNGSWDILEKFIFTPLDRGAFEAFKKVDPADPNAVIQTQVMSKVIDQIRKLAKTKIQEGKLARHTLSNSTPQEDEDV